MATVTNWIDHLSAKEVVGAVYPGAGSTETLLVILGVVFWIGWPWRPSWKDFQCTGPGICSGCCRSFFRIKCFSIL